MPTRFRRSARAALRWTFGPSAPQEPWWSECWSAVATALWGALGLINEPPTASVPALELASLVAADQFWYALAVVCGVPQFFVVRHRRMNARWWVALLLSGFWGTLVILTVMVDPARPGLSFYVVFALINLHSVLRLRVDPPP